MRGKGWDGRGGMGRVEGERYIVRAHHILKDLFDSCNEEYQGQRDDGGVPPSRGSSGDLLGLDSRGRGGREDRVERKEEEWKRE